MDGLWGTGQNRIGPWQSHPLEPDCMQAQPILICGAGPVGLTAANALARHGIPLRIIDVAEGPTTLSKALVIWQRTLQVLDSHVPLTAFLPHGNSLHRATFWAKEKVLGAIEMEDDPLNIPTGLLIPQSETERVLIGAAAERGIEVEWQTQLVDFAADDEGVTCRLQSPRGEEEMRCSRLIGCDGAHSVVRHKLGLAFPGEAVDRRWLLADIEVDQETDPHAMRIEASAEGMVALFPIGKSRWRVIADGGPAEDASERVEPTDAQIQALLSQRTATGWKITTAHWKSEFRVSERQIENYVHGRVTLAGDAAHVHSPAGGQGMNTGMQDAANMAWKIALVEKGGAPEGLIATYQEERHPIGAEVLKATGRMLRAAMISNPIARFLRNTAMHFGLSLPAVRAQLTKFLSEDNISVRGSSLCGPDEGGGKVRPGDAFPHLPIEQQGQRMSATHLLRGNEATAVVWGQACTESIGDTFGTGGGGFRLGRCELDVTEGTAHLRAQCGLTDDGCILVRPDGVVAAVGRTARVIEETMKQWQEV
ncbi:MAG: FAD-dependent monooxygenase [Pirellulales bacterium]|nr:FAD-dependent monooxygenase [Pirellulales bacterium]